MLETYLFGAEFTLTGNRVALLRETSVTRSARPDFSIYCTKFIETMDERSFTYALLCRVYYIRK